MFDLALADDADSKPVARPAEVQLLDAKRFATAPNALHVERGF
jgi:hypothetical protein